MIEAQHIRLTGKYPPFVPNNFYEAPQYASFRPIRIPFSTPPPRPDYPSSTVKASPQKRLSKRKTLRTVSVLFSTDGRMTGAKIDLATGEVQQHDYKDYFDKGVKARPKPDAADLEPFWLRMPAGSRSTGLPEQKDQSRKKHYSKRPTVPPLICLTHQSDLALSFHGRPGHVRTASTGNGLARACRTDASQRPFDRSLRRTVQLFSGTAALLVAATAS